MSEFKFSCPQCGQHIVCDERLSGSPIACPACQARINVPAPTAASAQQSAPSSAGDAAIETQWPKGLMPDGPPVDVRMHVEPKTRLHFAFGFCALMVGALVLGILTYGILWIVLLMAPLADFFKRHRTMALFRGSALEVGPAQFPELHQCAQICAQRLGLKTAPTVFIVEGNNINASALRVGSRNVVILIDDIVDACVRSGDPRTLGFILAHEMAHHALKHTGLVRSSIAHHMKSLARLDEFSCDSVAHGLVSDPVVAVKALTILLVGPQLLRYTNPESLLEQCRVVVRDKHSKKAERNLSHPLLLRRLHRFAASPR